MAKDEVVQTGNTEITPFASAAYTATQTAAFTNAGARGVILTFDVTVDPASAIVVLTIEYQDPASSKWEILLTAPAISAVGTTSYLLYPGASETESSAITLSIGYPLPRSWRVNMTHTDGDSITYSVGGSYII